MFPLGRLRYSKTSTCSSSIFHDCLASSARPFAGLSCSFLPSGSCSTHDSLSMAPTRSPSTPLSIPSFP
ncbi:hypothetical protein BD779DRAFT_1539548 [Infundibulicybe gibba]|nr:hypothetical protein BD779DRAFT_1539548 [Infundibulicybe gibba]